MRSLVVLRITRLYGASTNSPLRAFEQINRQIPKQLHRGLVDHRRPLPEPINPLRFVLQAGETASTRGCQMRLGGTEGMGAEKVVKVRGS